MGGMDADPEATLVFFNEVQACPRALTSLKCFQERAPEYCAIAAGSLLGVALGRSEYSFPVGKVDSLTMHPLDFEEYLGALGEERLADLIKEAYRANASLGLHDHALKRYQEYLLVGGLPEAVRAFAEGSAAREVRAIQQSISDAYLAGMTKYAGPVDSSKLLNVWRSVPEQLAKENRKFQYATIASSVRAFQYETPHQLASCGWFGVVTLPSGSEGRKSLRAFAEHGFFKLHRHDVGLLTAPQGLDADGARRASPKWISSCSLKERALFPSKSSRAATFRRAAWSRIARSMPRLRCCA